MPVVSALRHYPVKSCAGIEARSVDLWPTGPAHDRQWMLVDEDGCAVSQREAPRLALVRTAIRFDNLVLTAPGMLRLDLPVFVEEDAPETWCTVTIRSDAVQAVDEGDLCAQWFSDFLGRRVRLVKFHPDARRAARPAEQGQASILFSDGAPVLVLLQSELDLLATKLQQGGFDPAMADPRRFRPNIVIDDRDAPLVTADRPQGPQRLRVGAITLLRRAPGEPDAISDIDPQTGEADTGVMQTLQAWRGQDARQPATFGTLCQIEGADAATPDDDGAIGRLRVGDAVTAN